MEAFNEEERVSIFSRVFDLDGGARKKKVTPQRPSDPKGEPPHENHPPEHHGNHGSKAAPAGDKKDHGEESNAFGFGGAKSPYWLRGGAPGQIDLLSMFQKFGYLFLLVLLAVALATYLITTPFFYKFFFNPEKDDDYNFDSSDATHNTRYWKLFKVMLLYHVLILVCFLLVLLIMYGVVSVYYESAGMKAKGIALMDVYKEFLFTFDNHGTKMSVSDFYLTFIIVLIFGYLFYFFYFKYVLGYFANMTFPAYIDPNKSEKDEWDNPKKYIILYALMFMYIMAFALMVMNYVYGFSTPILFVWNIIFVFFLMLFMGLVFKYVLKKDILRFGIWTVVFVVLIILNKHLGGMFNHAIENMIAMFRQTH